MKSVKLRRTDLWRSNRRTKFYRAKKIDDNVKIVAMDDFNIHYIFIIYLFNNHYVFPSVHHQVFDFALSASIFYNQI